jgi:hypothetical protein
MLPIFFFFGLESYLGKYDQHSKYLSQLRESLLESGEITNRNSDRISSIISSIDGGDFSKAGECLRTGRAEGGWCKVDDVDDFYKNITVFDILKGGYEERVYDYIKDYQENIIKKEVIVNTPSFDFEYNSLSYDDIKIWASFNQNITAKRYSYYTSREEGLILGKSEYTIDNLGPSINYSNVAPVPGGRFRILAVSDSFAAGHGLASMDDTWARELERQLNEIEDKYEVVVLAQNGAGYKEFLSWVEGGYIKSIDPDLVLLSYFKNDFNLLYDFENNKSGQGGGLELNGLDKELVFYLRCFEEEDDFLGKSLKIGNKYFPSIYRFYKFSRCSEELSKLDSSNLIDKVAVVESYKKIDNLVKEPIFLYNITKDMVSDEQKSEILDEINKNGLYFINNPVELRRFNNGMCAFGFIDKLENCDEFKANKFNAHFNKYYNKGEIKGEIGVIKNKIDLALLDGNGNRDSLLRVNKNESIIIDYLPNTLFISNDSRERSSIGLFKGFNYGYGRSSENFCVPFDRKGVILNFNQYLTDGKEIKISSEFQRSGLGLVTRGYNEEGKVVYGKAIELKPGSPISFLGSESVRGIVVLSNNKNCNSDTDILDEFLLQIEIL